MTTTTVEGSKSSGKDENNFPEPQKRSSPQMLVHLIISFRDICVVTAALPLITLAICFVSAYIYQSAEIHETHCKVYNIIPSISAITGISPQRYLWRICIALHIGPRFAIATVYRNYYRSLNAQFVPEAARGAVSAFIKVVFALNVVEISALCCVTYVSNRENYPLHEKLFITFMITSLCHMLVSIKLLEKLRPYTATLSSENSLWWKKFFFGCSLASTFGLIVFFLKHRLLCHDLAFSWFAFCEYLIASANLLFHWTCTLDFPTEDFIIANCSGQIREVFEAQFINNNSLGGGDRNEERARSVDRSGDNINNSEAAATTGSDDEGAIKKTL